MKRESSEKMTVPDLVLLSLLSERPMHGYQANALLEFRKVRDWAGVSRPQVYYSLDKLARLGLIRPAEPHGESGGPERQVFETTAGGRAALSEALEREDWTNQIERPPFQTFMALSWQCRPGVFLKQARKRQEFLEHQLAESQEVLASVRKEVGHRFHEAVWMLSLKIDQTRSELRWLRKVVSEAPRRAAARRPEYLSSPAGRESQRKNR